MAVKNSLQQEQRRLGLTAYLTQDAVKKQINSIVGGNNGTRFISSIISAVSTNQTLKECTNESILSGALLGESLKLSPSPQLGHYYLVPFDCKEGKLAQFQMGYKGYIQLAIRSGQYKKLNVVAIKEGELEYFDPLNEEIKVNLLVDDWNKREASETVGYYAMFELVNGFKKAIYWSKEQMKAHAQKYSPGYRNDLRKHTEYTFWSKDFDGMAYKTMLRQLISKWGVMSIELQRAFVSDMGVINDDETVSYVETENYEEIEAPSDVAPEETKTTSETNVADALKGTTGGNKEE